MTAAVAAALQVAMLVAGLAALWMATGRSERMRKWAPIVGLWGQPSWLAYAYLMDAWGLFTLSLAYTLVYLRAWWLQWHK